MELIEVLLQIAEKDYCFNEVCNLLKTPKEQCPDVLFMALIQANSKGFGWSLILRHLMPVILLHEHHG